VLDRSCASDANGQYPFVYTYSVNAFRAPTVFWVPSWDTAAKNGPKPRVLGFLELGCRAISSRKSLAARGFGDFLCRGQQVKRRFLIQKSPIAGSARVLGTRHAQADPKVFRFRLTAGPSTHSTLRQAYRAAGLQRTVSKVANAATARTIADGSGAATLATRKPTSKRTLFGLSVYRCDGVPNVKERRALYE